ncbi:MAG: condensation domain-containing protein, partial [Stackebrandtia sp.]
MAGPAALIAGGTAGDSGPELVPRERPARVPLSAAQRRLWFLDRFDASGDAELSGVYNVPAALRMRGALDVDALHSALHALQQRHETLRTVFPEIEGEPYQQVLTPAAAAMELPVVDLDEGEIGWAVMDFAVPGFDLARRAPLRAQLLRIAADDHVLVLVVHHIAMDGWSLAPLAADIAVAYRAYAAGAAPQWEDLPVQYADYTLWLRDTLGSEEDPESPIARQLDYWRGALDGIPELLALPADRPRPPTPTYRGGTVDCVLDADTHRELQALATRHGVTMFMVLHAGLATLLHRMSAEDDITLGTPIAGRGRQELDAMIGMFVGTLVLRTPVSGGDSFADLLRTVRDADLEAFAHADVPFERLVEVLNPARSRAHHPMFQVMLSVRNEPVRTLELPHLRIEAHDADPGIAKFDLQFTLTESWTAHREPDGITISVNFARDLFDATTAARLGTRFARLLRAATANAELPVGDLDVLAPAERSALAPVRGVEAGAPRTLAEVFAAAVATDPGAVALRSGDIQISYEALDRWTNRLARMLIAHGVG